MGLSAAQPQTTPALGHLIEAEYHLRAAGQNIVADLIRLETVSYTHLTLPTTPYV